MDDTAYEYIIDWLYDKRDSFDVESLQWRVIYDLIYDIEEEYNAKED